MKKSLVIIIALIFIPSFIFGQSNDLEQKYTPKKNGIFNTSSNKTSTSTSKKIETIQNNIGFNPIVLFRNQILFHYEYARDNSIVFRGELGYCYGKDQVQSLIEVGDIVFGNDDDHINLGTMYSTSELKSGGLCFGAGVKFFSFDNVFDGGYFMVSYRHSSNEINWRTENTTYDSFGNSTTSTVNLPIKISNNSFNFIYGYQLSGYGKNPVIHDFYFGFGLKNVKYTGYEYGNGGYGTSYSTIQKTADDARLLVPTLLLGYTFSIGF